MLDAGPSNSIDFGGLSVALTQGGLDFRLPSGGSIRLQMADIQATLNWLAQHGYVGEVVR